MARRRDPLGDVLPAAMRWRLGSERFTDSSPPLVVSRDGTRIACGSTEGWVTVWDATGARRWRLRSPERPRTQARVEHLAFAPDATTLATTSSGRVTLWDLGTGKARWEQRLDHDFSQPLAFSFDGTLIAAGGSLCPARLLDAATGAVRRQLADAADHLAFSRDDRHVYVSRRRELTEVPVDGGEARRTCELPEVPGCSQMSNEILAHALGDGATVLAGHLAGGLYELDVATWTVVRHQRWPEGQSEVLFPSGLALGDDLVALARREVFVRRPGAAWECVPGPEPRGCAVTPGGDTLVIGQRDHLRVLDARSGAERVPIPRVVGEVDLATWRGVHGLAVPYHGRLALHDLATGAILHEGVLAEGRALIVDGRAGRVLIRGVGDRDRIWSFDGEELTHADQPRARCFAPDGTWLGKTMLGHQQGDALVLRYPDGRERELSSGGSTLYACAFSRDGQRLATGFYDRPGQVWSVVSGEPVGRIPVEYLWTVAWSPDDTRLLCGIHGGEVRIWNLAAARWDLVIKAHRGLVGAVAWSPDGRLLASTASSGIRLWDLGGAPRGKLSGDADQLRFTPDGTGLIVVRGSIVEVWEVAKL